jgi:hypothetical protein
MLGVQGSGSEQDEPRTLEGQDVPMPEWHDILPPSAGKL